MAGYVRERTGSILPNVSPANVYPTADGGASSSPATRTPCAKRLAEAMGRPELADDDALRHPHARAARTRPSSTT